MPAGPKQVWTELTIMFCSNMDSQVIVIMVRRWRCCDTLFWYIEVAHCIIYVAVPLFYCRWYVQLVLTSY